MYIHVNQRLDRPEINARRRAPLRHALAADPSLGIKNFSTHSFNLDDPASPTISTPAPTPPTMLQTIKPKNARSKRALEAREPKLVENQKTTLFLRGTSTSGIVQDALGDLHSLKKPHAVKFQKKNAVHPFEDASALEFFSRKNDASLMVFASHSKKRPHNLTFVRFFDYQVFDMVELLLDGETFRKMTDFKNAKAGVGLKPLLSFSGTIFDTNPTYNHLKLLLLDFFHGHTVTEVDVEALQYTIAISAGDATDEDPQPKIHLRAYMLKTHRSGHKLPRVELEEMGPRMDFRLGRRQEPNSEALKLAMARAKSQEMRSKKNISIDSMGDKVGRIHVGHQDLGQLQTRKMKGLRKRGRDDDDGREDVEMDDDDDDDDVEMGESVGDVPAVSPKRPRV
ncbi:rRNA-binding ribosome biosynthesis protein rpf2 [Orbilia brochopaga]|uniref:Ribosome production factor 2 homolog n=1 Tax=Orbilia brochopaga TaxID=3140254 RepID=A0AAV9UA94_9PEZI